MQIKKEVCALRVFENKKYPSGAKLVTCDFLASPLLNSKNFSSVDPKDYVWQTREWIYPLFKNKKRGDVFCIEIIVAEEFSQVKILNDTNNVNNWYIADAKKAFLKSDKHSKKQWARLKHSKFFRKPEKPKGKIEL